MENFNFRKLTQADYPLLTEYFKLSESGFCDFTLGAFFLWEGLSDARYAVYGDAFIICNTDQEGAVTYTPPLCKRKNEKEIITALYKYSAEKHGYFKLFPVHESKTEEYSKLLTKLTGKTPDIQSVDGLFDYLYDLNEITALSGKKYNGQRNHINRFLREYQNFSFEEITEKNIPEILKFFDRISSNAEGDAYFLHERQSLKSLLSSYETLSQTGVTLRVNGKIAGFAIGEVVNGILHEHIEKADKEIFGSFPFLTNGYLSFMKERFPEAKILNREEDLGNPGLRYSKESYHPLKKNYKYILSV